MDLKLSNLRADYKLIYKVQPDTAIRIAALIEHLKIEMAFNRPEFNPAKRIKRLALCQGLDISIRTLYRWRASYIRGGFIELTFKKSSGKKAKELTDVEKFLIKEMREKYRWGAEVIQAHLKYDHSVHLTKYRIERYLSYSGLRDEYPCTTKKRKLNQKGEHSRVVRIYTPGDHTQLDTKHQPHILRNGEKCYVFNFIDHASNWSYKRAYSSISPKCTIDFMKRLVKLCPFYIHRLQTDNGTEYTYKFYKRYADIKKPHPLEKFCQENHILQKLIPPGVKELQGLVERSHRQDDQELFSRIEPKEIDEFNHYLTEYYIERNKGRRFKKLDWRTADEWLRDYNRVQDALEFGHHYKCRKGSKELLPREKIGGVPYSNEQLPREKIGRSLNSCKERAKEDDKKDIKQAA